MGPNIDEIQAYPWAVDLATLASLRLQVRKNEDGSTDTARHALYKKNEGLTIHMRSGPCITASSERCSAHVVATILEYVHLGDALVLKPIVERYGTLQVVAGGTTAHPYTITSFV